VQYNLTLFKDWRLGAFCLALFLYALWGSPTPNNPDWVEATIAILLILALSWQGITNQFLHYKNKREEYWRLIAKIFFLYGVSVPLIIGAVQGENIIVILRDMIAFIFLCLPLFLYDFLKNKKVENLFLIMCIIIGLIFAVRVLVPHFLLFRNTTELLYLANSPLVLMTTIMLAGLASYHSFQNLNLKLIAKVLAFALLATIPLMAMFVDLQRASFVALILSAVSLGVIGFIKAPNKMIMPTLLLLLCFFMFEDYFVGLAQGVNLKTAQVGLNMREQEIMAVWNTASQNSLSLFFGQGWGSYFTSPAVGNLNVTFTHSLLSYIFLKTGLIGLCLCLIYLYFIFEKWVRLYCSNPVKGNALIWPFIIPIFLYASHKSFDYGLLLTLILVLSARKQVVTA
jgi:hypothetical protein